MAKSKIVSLVEEFSKAQKSGSITIHFSNGTPVKAETRVVDKLTGEPEARAAPPGQARSLHQRAGRGIR